MQDLQSDLFRGQRPLRDSKELTVKVVITLLASAKGDGLKKESRSHEATFNLHSQGFGLFKWLPDVSA